MAPGGGKGQLLYHCCCRVWHSYLAYAAGGGLPGEAGVPHCCFCGRLVEGAYAAGCELPSDEGGEGVAEAHAGLGRARGEGKEGGGGGARRGADVAGIRQCGEGKGRKVGRGQGRVVVGASAPPPASRPPPARSSYGRSSRPATTATGKERRGTQREVASGGRAAGARGAGGGATPARDGREIGEIAAWKASQKTGTTSVVQKRAPRSTGSAG